MLLSACRSGRKDLWHFTRIAFGILSSSLLSCSMLGHCHLDVLPPAAFGLPLVAVARSTEKASAWPPLEAFESNPAGTIVIAERCRSCTLIGYRFSSVTSTL